MAGTDTVSIRYYVRTDMVGSTCEDTETFDRAEWEGMSEADREQCMKEMAFNHLDWGFKVIRSDEDTVTVRFFVRTDIVGSKCEDTEEFDRDEWDAMSEADREQCMREAVFNFAEWGFNEVS